MKEAVLTALQNFKPRAADAWMLENAAYRQRLERQIVLFPAYALPDSVAPVCLCGVVHDFGVGELWMLTGEGFDGALRRLLPLSRELVRHVFEGLQLRRLELYVESARKESAIWAKHMGFTFEFGPLRGKGATGQDLDLWTFSKPAAEPRKNGENVT